jgi:DNA helicase-2/ATP-dependent DNA helicase PcrA
MAAPPYLASLNPEQRAAVEALDGPGAGASRRRHRQDARADHAARALAFNGNRAKPWSVLAVTFTNKAAREMRERVEKLLGPGGGGLPWLGTFHSISARMLRTHAELVGLKNNFTILDTDDQVRLLKQIIDAEGIDEKRWPGPPTR